MSGYGRYVKTLRGARDGQERYRLWSELGDAQSALGDHERAREAHLHAVELARVHADADALADAVLGYAGTGANMETRIASTRRIALLEESLRQEPRLAPVPAAALKARLAVDLRWAGRHEEVRPLVAEALDQVRESNGDSGRAAFVLHDTYWANWSPDNTEERIGVTSEMRGHAEAARDPVLCAIADWLHGAALLESGERDLAEAAYAIGVDVSEGEHAAVQLLRAGLRTCLAMLDGRFAEAETLAARACELGNRLGARNADGIFVGQLGMPRFDQERLSELAPGAPSMLGSSARPEVRAGRALLYGHAGRTTEARSEPGAPSDAERGREALAEAQRIRSQLGIPIDLGLV